MPQKWQDLHSIHCQRYVLTTADSAAENCIQEGCAGKRGGRTSPTSLFSMSLSFPLTRSPTVGTGHHFLWLARLLVPCAVPQTEVTVWVGLGQLLSLQVGRRGEDHWHLLLQRGWKRLPWVVLSVVSLQRGSRFIAPSANWTGQRSERNGSLNSRSMCVGCLPPSCYYYISKAYICRQRVCLSRDPWWRLVVG